MQALKYENFNDIEVGVSRSVFIFPYSNSKFLQAAYKRLAPENEVIKSLDDNENNSTTSESMGSPSE